LDTKLLKQELSVTQDFGDDDNISTDDNDISTDDDNMSTDDDEFSEGSDRDHITLNEWMEYLVKILNKHELTVNEKKIIDESMGIVYFENDPFNHVGDIMYIYKIYI